MVNKKNGGLITLLLLHLPNRLLIPLIKIIHLFKFKHYGNPLHKEMRTKEIQES